MIQALPKCISLALCHGSAMSGFKVDTKCRLSLFPRALLILFQMAASNSCIVIIRGSLNHIM